MNNIEKYRLSIETLPDNDSLDNEKRSKCLSSKIYSILHFREKKKLNNLAFQNVTHFFQQRYGIQDNQDFQRIWNELGEKIWSSNLPLTVGTLRQIDTVFQQQLHYYGIGIPTPPISHKGIDPTIRKLVFVLLHGAPLTADLLEGRVIKACLIKKDSDFLLQMRLALQDELNNLANNPPKTKQEEFLWRAFLGNVLSLLPYTYPNNNEKIVVPSLSDQGECKRVEYTIQVLPLTSTPHLTPLIALGLTTTDEQAKPILSYSGTTAPSGDGFATSICADFTPGCSVGKSPYLHGQEKIDSWMKGKKDVHVVGMSLGGALSLHTLRDHHASIGRMDIYNPPGLYPWEWKKEYNEGCDINIYCQSGDIVSKLGFWPKGDKVSLYRVISHQENFSEGLFSSHAKAFTGTQKVTILKKDPQIENQSWVRKFFTFAHIIFSPLVFATTCSLIMVYQLSKIIVDIFRRVVRTINSTLCLRSKKIKNQTGI